MSTLSLQLLKIPANNKSENDTLDTARAYIAVKCSSIEEVGKVEFTTISPECRSLREVKEEADRLIKELNAIKKYAASFFKKRGGFNA